MVPFSGDKLHAPGDHSPRDVAPVLASPIRQRVIAIASDVLGSLPDAEVPLSLRRVAKFAPSRRGRLAAQQIEASLEADVMFRQRTGERAATQAPGLATALRTGRGVVEFDPIERAALAYLIRPHGWHDVIARAADELSERSAKHRAEADAKVEDAARRRTHVESLHSEALAEIERLNREATEARAEVAKLRQRLGEARERARASDTAAAAAAAQADAADEQLATLSKSLVDAQAETRRLRQRLVDTDSALETLRRTAREGRTLESIRTRLLVDTLVEAAQGLRRELALPPLSTRPADLVAAASPTGVGTASVAGKGRDVDDPALLRALLELPQIHLVVDGYNVTKTGYGDIPLQDQRTRLLAGLAAVAAQTGAEVTCVFDGAALVSPVPLSVPRGVRVRFSPPGVIADDVIRDLVAAEPAGRPVAVVSSDREVADGVRSSGARPVAALALLRLLEGR